MLKRIHSFLVVFFFRFFWLWQNSVKDWSNGSIFMSYFLINQKGIRRNFKLNDQNQDKESYKKTLSLKVEGVTWRNIKTSTLNPPLFEEKDQFKLLVIINHPHLQGFGEKGWEDQHFIRRTCHKSRNKILLRKQNLWKRGSLVNPELAFLIFQTLALPIILPYFTVPTLQMF